uniref:Uncharacterized protein n=1 Tax=Human herpesvirus 6B TaxID=32604 RepID=A0A2L2QDS1_HHV6H|nr:hypothetical protein [Human betaherpesvirus 6B]AVI09186.1 hypothetical protein [Human betaherpesvirus 6B]
MRTRASGGEGRRPQGERVEGERVEGERVEGERVEGERVEGEWVEGSSKTTEDIGWRRVGTKQRHVRGGEI